MSRATGGFTLMELMAVIGVIAILATILLPTLSYARTAAAKARTRTQFSEWAAAFEAFRQEYGSYPQFSTTAAQKVVNPAGTSTTASASHLFYDVLSGVHRDGSQLTGATTGNPTPALGQNTRRIRFVSFTDNDLVTSADVTAGYNTAAQLNYVRDGFHNTSIAVITDANLDGVINRNDASGYPAVTPPGATTPSITPLTTDLPTGTTGGIHQGVIFYCAPPGAATGSDLIMSWK